MTSLDIVWMQTRRAWRDRLSPTSDQLELALGAALWLALIVMAGRFNM